MSRKVLALASQLPCDVGNTPALFWAGARLHLGLALSSQSLGQVRWCARCLRQWPRNPPPPPPSLSRTGRHDPIQPHGAYVQGAGFAFTCFVC